MRSMLSYRTTRRSLRIFGGWVVLEFALASLPTILLRVVDFCDSVLADKLLGCFMRTRAEALCRAPKQFPRFVDFEHTHAYNAGMRPTMVWVQTLSAMGWGGP